MIHAIVEYARQSGLDAEPGFSPKFARWAVRCEYDGRYLGVQELGDADAKRNRGLRFAKCPNLTQPEMQSGGFGARPFLLDAASVVAGLGNELNTVQSRAKHQFFTATLIAAAQDVPILAAPARCLSNPDHVQKIRADLEEKKANPTDNVTFLVDGIILVASSDWHDWWRVYRQRFTKTKAKESEEGTMRCFLTGELVKPASTHEKIQGLSGVGGLSMGDALVAFKQESFCSFGFNQSANAAMSVEAAKTYQAGLNDLVAKGRTLVGTRVAHWFRSAIPQQEDPLDFLLENDEEQKIDALDRAKQLLGSIYSGQRAELLNNTYYVLTLSGASGRVMVRDWEEGSFEQLVHNITAWFEDLSIVAPDGRSLAHSPRFMAVLAATVRDLKDLSAPLIASIWKSSVHNDMIPEAVHSQALARVRVSLMAGETPRLAGIGLLKAYHLRKCRQEKNMTESLKPGLNPEHPSAAYQCGRMMSVLASLQACAMPEVKTGVVQRYYGAASTTPALVLGRLLGLAQVHKDKLAQSQPELAEMMDRRLAEIAMQISPDGLPKLLTMEEQSLFALGYYQQSTQGREN
jgi:CRISPR-associated protein Csd1